MSEKHRNVKKNQATLRQIMFAWVEGVGVKNRTHLIGTNNVRKLNKTTRVFIPTPEYAAALQLFLLNVMTSQQCIDASTPNSAPLPRPLNACCDLTLDRGGKTSGSRSRLMPRLHQSGMQSQYNIFINTDRLFPSLLQTSLMEEKHKWLGYYLKVIKII